MATGLLALVGLFDWLLNLGNIYLPGELRALFLVGILSGAGYIVYQHLLQPLRTPADVVAASGVSHNSRGLCDELEASPTFELRPNGHA